MRASAATNGADSSQPHFERRAILHLSQVDWRDSGFNCVPAPHLCNGMCRGPVRFVGLLSRLDLPWGRGGP